MSFCPKTRSGDPRGNSVLVERVWMFGLSWFWVVRELLAFVQDQPCCCPEPAWLHTSFLLSLQKCFTLWCRCLEVLLQFLTVCLVFFLLAANLQEKLTDFLPKLLDCSTEIKSFHDPPKLPGYSTLELCERFGRIMAAISRAPAEGRWAARRRRSSGQARLRDLSCSPFLINPGLTCSSLLFLCYSFAAVDFIIVDIVSLFFYTNTVEERGGGKMDCREEGGGVRKVGWMNSGNETITFCFSFKNHSLVFLYSFFLLLFDSSFPSYAHSPF